MKQIFMIVMLFYLFGYTTVFAQKTAIAHFEKYRDSTVASGTDPNYILSYGTAFVGRVYTGHNYNHFTIGGKDGQEDLSYRGNFRPNVGFGFSYSFLTLNFSFGLGNPPANKGNSGYFSLQSNLYYRKWAVDIVFKTLKGMYIADKDIVSGVPGYYLNPKMHSVIAGGSVWRILNPSKFSFKAVMTQSEWQKKSAGTFLLGAETYFGYVDGNDSLIPAGVGGNYPLPGVSRISAFKIGPGIGYAYTFVFKRHWFAGAYLMGNLDASINDEKKDGVSKYGFALIPNYNFRIGVGYNSQNWNINFNWQNNTFPLKGTTTDIAYHQLSGNYRLSFNRRFYFTKRKKVFIDQQ